MARPSIPCAGQGVPAASAGGLQDHVIRETVNQLRDIALKYHAAGQLREQIAHVIVPLLQNRAPATSAAGQDAARLVKLLQMCTEAKTKFGPTGTLRQITMTFKTSVETSRGYREELRKLVDEMKPSYAPTVSDRPTAVSAGGQHG